MPVRRRVVLVGIAGASGSGKSSLARILAERFCSPLESISGDQYNSPATTHPVYGKDWETPAGMNFKLLREDLLHILDTLATARSLPALRVGPRKELLKSGHGLSNDNKLVFVFVESFLLFHDEELTRMCDVKLWIEADCETCLLRRFHRRQKKKSLEEFESFFRGLVWKSYLEYRGVQVANAHDALILPGEVEIDDVAKMAETHCRHALSCCRASSAAQGSDACGSRVHSEARSLTSRVAEEKPLRCRRSRRERRAVSGNV